MLYTERFIFILVVGLEEIPKITVQDTRIIVAGATELTMAYSKACPQVFDWLQHGEGMERVKGFMLDWDMISTLGTVSSRGLLFAV